MMTSRKCLCPCERRRCTYTQVNSLCGPRHVCSKAAHGNMVGAVNLRTSASPAWNLPRRTSTMLGTFDQTAQRCTSRSLGKCSGRYKSVVGGDLASMGDLAKRSGMLLQEAPVVRVEVPPRPLLVRVRRFRSDQPWTPFHTATSSRDCGQCNATLLAPKQRLDCKLHPCVQVSVPQPAERHIFEGEEHKVKTIPEAYASLHQIADVLLLNGN